MYRKKVLRTGTCSSGSQLKRNSLLLPYPMPETSIDLPSPRRARFKSGRDTVKRMAQALVATNGSFVLSAKLLDMRPGTFRSKVFYHRELRERFGHRKTGRPPGGPKLQVQAVRDTPAHRVARKPIDFIFEIVDCLPRERQEELQQWLQAKLNGAESRSNVSRHLKKTDKIFRMDIGLTIRAPQ